VLKKFSKISWDGLEKTMADETGRRGSPQSIRDSFPSPLGVASCDPPELYEFGPFRLEPDERKLLRGEEVVALTPKAFDTLVLLVRNTGHLLEKDELIRALWPESFVEEGNLTNNVFLLRKALGEDPQYIETVPKRGYRFVGAVRQLPKVAPTQAMSGPVLQGTPPVETKRPLVEVPKNLGPLGLAAIAVAVLAIAAIGWKISFGRSATPKAAPQIRSLAVLPLENLSRDPEQEYFSDALTEGLTNDLGKFNALRVISRTSTMQYKVTKKTIPEIARDLNVDAVIEGTVLRSGNQVRITVNLIQAQPEKHIWAESYDTEAGNILSVQASLAQSVAQQIQITLTPPEQFLLKNRTVDPVAQDLYFRGVHALDSETAESARSAIDYFQQAIQKDPTYGPAYAGLAMVYAIWYPGEPEPRQKMPKAREAAEKALSLDDTLPRAHRAMGIIELCYDWNWVGAEKEFRRALELDPNDPVTHAHYAQELVILGRTDEGLAHARQAVKLDPYSPEDWPLWATYLAHRYDEALQLAKAKIALNPNYPWNHYDLALVYEQMGKPAESIQEYLKFEALSGAAPQDVAILRETADKSGFRGFWKRRLEQYRRDARSQYVSNGMVADACARVREKDCAFEWLEKAFQERDDLMINLNLDPVFDGIRMDPRFQDLARRVGLPVGKPGE